MYTLIGKPVAAKSALPTAFKEEEEATLWSLYASIDRAVVVVAPVLRLPQPNAARDSGCLKIRPEPVLANNHFPWRNCRTETKAFVFLT